LKAKRNELNLNIDGPVFASVMKDAFAKIALANFRESMRNPAETGFFCFRAIEAIMQSMKTNPNEKDEKAWTRLRDVLRVDWGFIKEIKKHADHVRHGKPSAISDSERAKVYDYTDRIIDRYLRYIVSGRAGLSPAEFEVLKV